MDWGEEKTASESCQALKHPSHLGKRPFPFRGRIAPLLAKSLWDTNGHNLGFLSEAYLPIKSKVPQPDKFDETFPKGLSNTCQVL